MSRTKFNDLVLSEATQLREHATEEQKNKLDFSTLDGCDPHLCIYGQMSGSCLSDEAEALIKKCVTTGVTISFPFDPHNVDEAEEVDFDYWYKQNVIPSKEVNGDDYSPIEAYIQLEDANNEGLIKFIKGEIDTVEL